jgi:PAS domain S-box-containing protein
MDEPEYLDALCNTADGVYIVNADQRIVRWNKGAERILQRTEAETLNQECYRVIAGQVNPSKTWCHMNCKVHTCAAQGTPVENFNILTHDNSGRAIWLNVSVITPTNNGETLMVHILRDITRERQVGQAVEQFMMSIGARGRGKSNSHSANYSRKESAGKSFTFDLPTALSGREIEVLTLLAEGLSTKALAQRLNISYFTARNHVQNILVKLNLHNKSQAVAFAFKKGLL